MNKVILCLAYILFVSKPCLADEQKNISFKNIPYFLRNAPEWHLIFGPDSIGEIDAIEGKIWIGNQLIMLQTKGEDDIKECSIGKVTQYNIKNETTEIDDIGYITVFRLQSDEGWLNDAKFKSINKECEVIIYPDSPNYWTFSFRFKKKTAFVSYIAIQPSNLEISKKSNYNKNLENLKKILQQHYNFLSKGLGE